MVKPALRTLVAALLLSALSAGSSPLALAETLRIGGTGAALGVMRLLGDAFTRTHESVTFKVLPSLGSSGGIKALLAGALDLAVISRDLKDEERARGLSLQTFGKTALVFATRQDTTASNISGAEVVAIFSGAQTAWADGHPVRPILRDPSDSDTHLIGAHIPGMREALKTARGRPAIPVLYTDQEAADELERIPGSLGTTTLAVILSERRKLKVLVLDRQPATPQSLADGTYPMTKTCGFVFSAQPSAVIKDFLAFVSSPAGRAILERNSYQALPATVG